MENKKLLLIVNPCSGKAKMKSYLLEVVQILSGGGFEVTVYPTKARGDATVYVQTLQNGQFDRIVVCGGDGTLNEVITGLMNAGLTVNLGYIPSGTLNEWSSSLHIAREIPAAAESILGGNEITLDIGQFGDRYFSYTASFGAFTSASYSAPQGVKNVLGQAAYFFEGVKSITSIKSSHLTFVADDRTVEGDFLFGAVSNSMSVGGIVKFDEALVKLNDGEFEVFLIHKPKNVVQLQKIVDGILRHDLTREGMEFFHTKAVTVTGGEEVAWTLDGEYAPGADSVLIQNVPSALHLIVPAGNDPKCGNDIE